MEDTTKRRLGGSIILAGAVLLRNETFAWLWSEVLDAAASLFSSDSPALAAMMPFPWMDAFGLLTTALGVGFLVSSFKKTKNDARQLNEPAQSLQPEPSNPANAVAGRDPRIRELEAFTETLIPPLRHDHENVVNNLVHQGVRPDRPSYATILEQSLNVPLSLSANAVQLMVGEPKSSTKYDSIECSIIEFHKVYMNTRAMTMQLANSASFDLEKIKAYHDWRRSDRDYRFELKKLSAGRNHQRIRQAMASMGFADDLP